MNMSMATILASIELISVQEWIRMVLLYSHLLIAALAVTQVLFTDLSIAAGRFTRPGLQRTTHHITLLLLALWATGLGIIYLDTGFDIGVLATKPKLILKLLCVAVLTLNGYVLHRFSFPVVVGEGVLTKGQTLLLALTGSLSTSHWLMAAFVGTSKPLGKLPLEVLLWSYSAICVMTLLIGLLCMSTIRQRLLLWRIATNGRRGSTQALPRGHRRSRGQQPDSPRSAPLTNFGSIDINLGAVA